MVKYYDPYIYIKMCCLLWLCVVSSQIECVFFFFSLYLAPVSSQTAEEAQTAPADPASPNPSKSFTLGNAVDMRVSTSCPTATLHAPSKGLWILCVCYACVVAKHVHMCEPVYSCSVCIAVQMIFTFSIKSHTNPYTQELDCCWLISP